MPEQVIIASVTKMSRGLCIGGYVLARGWSHANLQIKAARSIRLVPAGELWHPNTNQWRPGQIITAEISERENKTPPHTEDVTLHKWSQHGCRTLLGHSAMESCNCLGGTHSQHFPLILKEIALDQAFRGSVSGLFDGKITRKPNGRAVVSSRELQFSTQWWMPEVVSVASDEGYLPVRIVSSQYKGDLILEAVEEGSAQSPPSNTKWTFKYVGVNPICKHKVRENVGPDQIILLRMSLARWWAAPADSEVLCYGDLSSAWSFSEKERRFEPLECASLVNGKCECKIDADSDGYLWLWGGLRNGNEDLPF